MTELLITLKAQLRASQSIIQNNRLSREKYWERRRQIAEILLVIFVILFASAFVNGWNWSNNIVITLGIIGFLGVYASYFYAKEANTQIERDRAIEMGYGIAIDVIEQSIKEKSCK